MDPQKRPLKSERSDDRLPTRKKRVISSKLKVPPEKKSGKTTATNAISVVTYGHWRVPPPTSLLNLVLL